MSIIKSRGTAHSNQVRKLILSDKGVTLADAYTAGGDVLMGTLRWQKESAERSANEVAEVAAKLKHVSMDVEEAEIEVRMKSLLFELAAKLGGEGIVGPYYRDSARRIVAGSLPHAGVTRCRSGEAGTKVNPP